MAMRVSGCEPKDHKQQDALGKDPQYYVIIQVLIPC